MNTNDLINKMVAELNTNPRKYNDGCGEVNYDLLASEIGSKLRLMNRNDLEAPEWVWESAVEASNIYKKNKAAQRQSVRV